MITSHARRCRPTDARGIVTIEFACGILASIIVMIMLGWAVFLFGVKIGLTDAVGQVARQAARQDASAVRDAERDGPPGASYQIRRRAGSVEVVGTVDARPLAGMPAFRLTATAVSLVEPVVDGDR